MQESDIYNGWLENLLVRRVPANTFTNPCTITSSNTTAHPIAYASANSGSNANADSSANTNAHPWTISSTYTTTNSSANVRSLCLWYWCDCR